jgi:hypothetical protein
MIPANLINMHSVWVDRRRTAHGVWPGAYRWYLHWRSGGARSGRSGPAHRSERLGAYSKGSAWVRAWGPGTNAWGLGP